MNLLEVMIPARGEAHVGGVVISTPAFLAGKPGASAMIGIRPEHLEISAEGRFSLQAEFVEKLGSVQLVHGSFAGKDFILQCPATYPVVAGQQLRFDIPAASMHAFDPTTGARLLQPEAIERRKETIAA